MKRAIGAALFLGLLVGGLGPMGAAHAGLTAKMESGPPATLIRAYPGIELSDLEAALGDPDEVEAIPLSHPRTGPPFPSGANQIGPGSHLIINRPDGTFGCTANFVWKDRTGDVYLGSAGHCFMPEAYRSTHNEGAGNYDPARTRVFVCRQGCSWGGQLGFDMTGTLVELKPVVYARQRLGSAEVGHDFGLVKIPEPLGRAGYVHPHMPVWNGPVGEAKMLRGTLALHFGQAAGFGETLFTQARAGRGDSSNANAWFANTPSFQGDSGAAVEDGVVTSVGGTVIEGRGAIGVLTHIVAPSTGIIAGTTVARARAMAQEAGLDIRIVQQNEKPYVPPAAPQAVAAEAGPGAGEVTISWQPPADHGGFTVSGYNVYGGDDVDALGLVGSVDASARSFVQGGLPPGATRVYAVSAVNAAGEGTRSATVEATTLAPPTQPLNVVGLGRFAAVELRWDPPASDGGSPVTMYRVAYWAERFPSDVSEATTTWTTLRVEGLHNGLEYVFVVAAENAVGVGASAEPVTVRPLPDTVPSQLPP